jgi:hypothetical protein
VGESVVAGIKIEKSRACLGFFHFGFSILDFGLPSFEFHFSFFVGTRGSGIADFRFWIGEFRISSFDFPFSVFLLPAS